MTMTMTMTMTMNLLFNLHYMHVVQDTFNQCTNIQYHIAQVTNKTLN